MANSGKDINFGADLLPTEDGVYNLGSTSNKWNAIYCATVDATSLVHSEDGADHFELWVDSNADTGYAEINFFDYYSEFDEIMVSLDNHAENLIFNGKAQGLNVSAGSSTQPTYINGDGIPTACTYSLNANVPSGAKFTDTTYSVATTSAAGLMSATDKSKLDGITTGANAYTLPTASTSTLGGVKVGNNLSIYSGVLSANLGGVTLYSSTSGTQSTVTLSAYASNYSYLDIYYGLGENSATAPECSTRVICPTTYTTNKYVVLNMGYTASSQYIQWKHETLRIYGKYIYRVDAGYVNADKNANSVSCGSGGGNPYITRVVGIK